MGERREKIMFALEKSRFRGTGIVALSAGLLLSLAACGGSTSTTSSAAPSVAPPAPAPAVSSAPASEAPKELRPVTVLMDWFPNPDHVSLYVTKAKGYFEEMGLDVTLQPPSDPTDAPKLVSLGDVELGISYEPEMFFSAQAGLKLKAVAALIPTSLSSVIWLKDSPVKSLADLGGQTVGDAGLPTDNAFWSAIFAANNVDPESVDVVTLKTSLNQGLISGKVAAVVGAYGNIEGVQLAEEGLGPVITRVTDAGVPNYDELVIIANSDRLASDTEYQQVVRDFLAALAKGTADAIADPAFAEATMSGLSEDYSGPSLTAMIKATLPLLENPAGFGQMDATEWDSFGAFLKAEKLIDTVAPAADIMTTEFLPAP